MYLVSQIWLLLILSFLLGALIGYFIWRLCARPMLENRYERSRKEMNTRLGLMETEHRDATNLAARPEAEAAKRNARIASLQSASTESAETIARMKAAESRQKSEAERLQQQIADLEASKAEAARKAAEHDAKAAAELKKAQSSHAVQMDKLKADLASKHSDEVEKLNLTVKAHESKVLLLSSSGDGAKKELDTAKHHHAEELRKVQTDLAAKHAAELKSARDAAMAEAERRHVDAIKKAREDMTASHGVELRKAREDAVADASGRHAEELARRDRHAAAAAPANVAAPATSHSAPPQNADDLKLIWGVGPEIEKLLHQRGVTRFSQMAAWTEADLEAVEAALPSFKERPTKEKWTEQAQRLATGWRPDNGAGDRPNGLLTTARGGKADDLKLIWGVGPRLEELLNSAGIFHFDQIAYWTEKDIAWIDSKVGAFAGRASRDNWIDQSKKLATGWRPENEVGDKPKS